MFVSSLLFEHIKSVLIKKESNRVVLWQLQFIDASVQCYTCVRPVQTDSLSVCLPISVLESLSRWPHICWLPFWRTADICLLSPSNTLLGMGLWHFWQCVSPCVCMHVYVHDELLGHAPLTFYWMLMAFIHMAAGGVVGEAVWVTQRLSLTCRSVCVHCSERGGYRDT